MPTCCRKGDPEYEDPVIYIGEVLNQKKRCKIPHLGGGVWTNFCHFHTFFIIFFLWGERGTTSPENKKSVLNFPTFVV